VTVEVHEAARLPTTGAEQTAEQDAAVAAKHDREAFGAERGAPRRRPASERARGS
jgi:hypothetical protein